jgi:sulfide:quinone oxidoreductase
MTRTRALRVLIAGGGLAAAEALLALRALAQDRVEITLLCRRADLVYRPMSVAEPFDLGHAEHFDLEDLCASQSAELIEGALVAVDPDAWTVETDRGSKLSYDALLIAVGARQAEGLRGALTFGGPDGVDRYRALLHELEQGAVKRLAFVNPRPGGWTLPLYELALLTHAWASARALPGVELVIVTAELYPLEAFGSQAGDEMTELLERRGILSRNGSLADSFRDGDLWIPLEGTIPVDRVIVLPQAVGRSIPGLPSDSGGFLPIDAHTRVVGFDDVYAAGDSTAGLIKQGGLAAQQADAAAEAIAAQAGVPLRPAPYDPVLRGLLLTGAEPLFLKRASNAGGDDLVTKDPPWWPPTKFFGRHLSAYLATRTLGS